MSRDGREKASGDKRPIIKPESDERPYWMVDRDLTNRISNEATAGRHPVADEYSPASDFDGARPARPASPDDESR